MATGYLVKRVKNGIVVIQEKFVQTPQGQMSSFAVDDDSTLVFKTWEEAAAWLGMRMMPATEGQAGSVSQIRLPDA